MKIYQKVIILILITIVFTFTGTSKIKAFTTAWTDNFENFNIDYLYTQSNWDWEDYSGDTIFSVSSSAGYNDTKGINYITGLGEIGKEITEILTTGNYSIRFYIKPTGWQTNSSIVVTWGTQTGHNAAHSIRIYAGSTTNQWCVYLTGETYGSVCPTRLINKNAWTQITININIDTKTTTASVSSDSNSFDIPERAWTSSYDINELKIYKDGTGTTGYIDNIEMLPALTWDDSTAYDYIDGIKNFRIIWHEANGTGGNKFGLGVDIQNDFYSWDTLILEVDSPSIYDTWDLVDVVHGLLQAPSVIVNSTDYVEWWEDGEYDLTFSLSKDGVPDTGTILTITLREPLIPITQTEWEDFGNYKFEIQEIEEWEKYKQGPMIRFLNEFKQKFPIGWVWTIYDIWTEEYDEVLGSEATDSLSVAFTMPAGVAFAGVEIPLLDLSWAKNNFATQFALIREVLVYIVWVSACFAITRRSINLIKNLSQS